ncbi:Kinesin-like protein, partial [Globisporangium splendens]
MSTDVNVKVAVRCRPMSSREMQIGAQSIVRVSDGTTIVIQATAIDENSSIGELSAASSDHNSTRKQFTFDHAYGSDSVQSQVYDDIVRPTVEKALQGYNGTIFTYGQTGSGKTHTMMGSGDDHGIIPLMNLDIFERVDAAQRADPVFKFLVTVSFLEIYNEVIKDLLDPSDKVLKIREHPDMGIYVEQLAELIVKDAHEVARLLQQGNKVCQVAAAQMNERSSRSHSCFTIKIASKRQEVISSVQKEIAMNAKINLVDLAGSERASKTGATGDRLKEGAGINKSLSALGNVINMLAASDKGAKGKSAHVPYRDSKLMRLLQESLGGNSLTMMVAAISPADYNYDESMSTLLYANRAKSIKNATKKNEDVNEKIIRELREETEGLRQMVRPSSSQGQSTTGSEMTVQMEETIANLECAKQQSWEEKQRLTELYEQERLNSPANEKKILGFMQTMKQEKMDIMKRIKALQQRKLQVTKQLRQKKHSCLQHKSQLQTDVETFQQQQANTTLSPSEKQRLMESIESCKTLVIEDRDEMVRLKDELKLCEDKLVEEEAEVAAKSAPGGRRQAAQGDPG